MAEKEYINLYECRDDFYATVLDILSEDSTNDRANQIIDAFDYLPTADVAPVKHGHWIEEYDCGYITPHCSECGETALTKEETSYDYVYSSYCPNCGARLCRGAKMDGGEGE